MQLSYVYILTNSSKTVLYVGVTSDLAKRIIEHKQGIGSAFTKRYNVKFLIYFEQFTDISQAILREKQLKNWHKEWKWNLIKEANSALEELEIL